LVGCFSKEDFALVCFEKAERTREEKSLNGYFLSKERKGKKRREGKNQGKKRKDRKGMEKNHNNI